MERHSYLKITYELKILSKKDDSFVLKFKLSRTGGYEA